MSDAASPRPGDLGRLLAQLHADLDLLSYYNLLGIPQDADPAAVRSAFHARASVLHPDRYPQPAQAPLRAHATALYKRLAEAMRVLSDPAQRADYDALLARGTLRLTPEAVEALRAEQAPASPEDRAPIRNPQAAQFYNMGKRELRRQEFSLAVQYLEQAHALEPASARIRAALEEARQLQRLYGG